MTDLLSKLNEEFDIEKVESIDYDYIKSQVSCIFQTENDCTNFINFLKNMRNFVSLSADKRHICLVELCYFKSQIQLFEKRIKSVYDQLKSKQLKEAVKCARLRGEKITEFGIQCGLEETETLQGLSKLCNLVSSWYNYLQDLYFVCGQTNKNLGGLN